MVQIVDSRRLCSLPETANVTRLTYLAIIFVPLSFTASLFSMNTEIAPGSRGFWIHFCVAIPLTLVSFLATLLPVSRIIQAQRFFDARKLSTASREKKIFWVLSPDHRPWEEGCFLALRYTECWTIKGDGVAWIFIPRETIRAFMSLLPIPKATSSKLGPKHYWNY
jgi:hypothetical protein